jgi:hypothetical protein
MKRAVIFLVMLILAIGLVSAADLEIKHTGPSYVQAGAEANFTVIVKNLGYREETLNIRQDPLSSLPSSRFDYILLETTKLVLGSNEEKSFNVRIKLKKTIPTDENYGTHILFTSPFDENLRLQHGFILRVVPPEDILDLSVSIPDRVGPGKDLEFEIVMENNLNTQLNDVRVIVSSELFNDEKDIRLFALQERNEKYVFQIETFAEPKDYELNIRVIYNSEIIDRATAKFSVLKNADVKEIKHETTGFLTKTYSVVKTNYGNSAVEESYKLDLSRFQKWFVSYSEDPYEVNEEVVWRFVIDPDSSHKVSATVSYRPLALALLVIIVFGFLAYFWMTKNLTIKKQILKVSENKDGISELKILLHIKNKTARTLRHLAVVETLPKIIEPTNNFGTLSPEKVQKGDKGVRMMWVVPELVRGEERIISYKVKSKINIVGAFLLPTAKVRYKRAGKLVTVESNQVRFVVGGSEKNNQ